MHNCSKNDDIVFIGAWQKRGQMTIYTESTSPSPEAQIIHRLSISYNSPAISNPKSQIGNRK